MWFPVFFWELGFLGDWLLTLPLKVSEIPVPVLVPASRLDFPSPHHIIELSQANVDEQGMV